MPGLTSVPAVLVWSKFNVMGVLAGPFVKKTRIGMKSSSAQFVRLTVCQAVLPNDWPWSSALKHLAQASESSALAIRSEDSPVAASSSVELKQSSWQTSQLVWKLPDASAS